MANLECLKYEAFPGHKNQEISIKYSITYSGMIIDKSPIENSEIKNEYDYHKMVKTDFDKVPGAEGFIFNNKEIINKQRAVAGYMVKKLGSNLISGKSIMNISLPINIFDTRSLLNV